VFTVKCLRKLLQQAPQLVWLPACQHFMLLLSRWQLAIQVSFRRCASLLLVLHALVCLYTYYVLVICWHHCRVSCRGGHVAAVRQLLAALHCINNEDCGVLALTYASSTSNTAAIQAVLDSPQLTAQLSR
jgi:hypothetical protein